jgi:hypothetical protein
MSTGDVPAKRFFHHHFSSLFFVTIFSSLLSSQGACQENPYKALVGRDVMRRDVVGRNPPEG